MEAGPEFPAGAAPRGPRLRRGAPPVAVHVCADAGRLRSPWSSSARHRLPTPVPVLSGIHLPRSVEIPKKTENWLKWGFGRNAAGGAVLAPHEVDERLLAKVAFPAVHALPAQGSSSRGLSGPLGARLPSPRVQRVQTHLQGSVSAPSTQPGPLRVRCKTRNRLFIR